jgi:hypothetical protein
MWNMNEVKTIKYRNNYTYHIIFEDGTNGDIDLANSRC